MNREIKFRIFDRLLNRYILWNSLPVHDFNDKNYVYEQFTGLKDWEEREIFEGDIVIYYPDESPSKRIGLIEFSKYYNGWAIIDSKCYPESEFGVISLSNPYFSLACISIEIIGNKYEDAILLK